MNESAPTNRTLRPATLTAAEIYDRDFVPALFERWAPVVCTLADIRPGHRVLDVATGTGVLARTAARRVGPEGQVEGLDPNPEMLAVARCKPEAVTWTEGRAEALPLADDTCDRVVSQFGMMFFTAPVTALDEARRVLRRGGRLAFAVCGPVDWSAGYSVFVELLHRCFGAEVAASFRAPFALGCARRLSELAAQANLRGASILRREGVVRFDSIRALVAAERACAWTLGGLLDDVQFERLAEEAETSLSPFMQDNGEIVFDMPALILTAER